ncbi:MAG TPA: glutaredoxin family protein [Blastocatellia bacterium]|nr:glutaredoxin family protein [Blastocatellia bacterium]
MIKVVIYTRPGCHLCEEAKAIIQEARAERPFSLEEVNIDLDPQAADLYRYDIPVIFINGVKVFKHRVSARDFIRKLRRLS